MADADPLTSTAPYPTEQPEILLVDLNGLKLVERGDALGIALSLGRDGLADVVQYARANPDADPNANPDAPAAVRRQVRRLKP